MTNYYLAMNPGTVEEKIDGIAAKVCTPLAVCKPGMAPAWQRFKRP